MKITVAKRRTRDCFSHTVDELVKVIRVLWQHRSPELSKYYSKDDGRSYPHEDVDSFESAWLSLGHEQASLGAACADIAKLFVHHLTETSRQKVLKESIVSVPLLSPYDETHAAKGDAYAQSLTCVVGHNMTKRTCVS